MEVKVIDTTIYEKSNLPASRTKLRYSLWIDDKGATQNVPHNLPRIKVALSDTELTHVSIDRVNPKILVEGKKIPGFKEVQKFIITYYDELMAQWNQEWDFTDLSNYITYIVRFKMNKQDTLAKLLNDGTIFKIPNSLKNIK